MSAIEKICEYSGEYEGGVMYGYKRNHIQVLKRHRPAFKDKPAWLFIVDQPEAQEAHPSLWVYASLSTPSRYFHVRVLPRFWKPSWWRWKFSAYKPRYYQLEYHYVLWVPDVPGQVDGLYLNWTYTPRKAVRKLRKLVDLQRVDYPSGSTNDSLMDAVRGYVAWRKENPITEEEDE